jgi:hypothetical protein
VPRNIQTRPTPGDTVPELRSDPATTIPFPVARRRRPAEQGQSPSSERSRTRWQSQPEAATGQPASAPETREQQDPIRSWSLPRRPAAGTSRAAPSGSTPAARRRDAESQPQATPPREEERRDRDVLRRLFRPLTEGRDQATESGREGARSRPESGSSGSRPSTERRSTPTPPPQVERSRPRPDSGSSLSRPRSEPRSTPTPSPQVERSRPRPEKEKGSGAVRRKREKEKN